VQIKPSKNVLLELIECDAKRDASVWKVTKT